MENERKGLEMLRGIVAESKPQSAASVENDLAYDALRRAPKLTRKEQRPPEPPTNLDRERILRHRSLARAYDNLCQMTHDDLSAVNIKILRRTIWSLKQLIKATAL
jgi:hypothetical protein